MSAAAIQRFRQAAAVAGIKARLVRDFTDSLSPDEEPRGIAAKALLYLCFEDDSYVRNPTPVVAVINYLNDEFPPGIKIASQAVYELAALLVAFPSEARLLEWIRVNF